MDRLPEFIGNHPLLFAALIAVLVFIVVSELRRKSGPKMLTPKQLIQLMNSEQVRVVDLRPLAEYKEGHILTAENIPLTQLSEQVEQRLPDKQAPLVAYCKTGSQTAEACTKLQQAGYSQVYGLKNGLYAWQEEQFPLAK